MDQKVTCLQDPVPVEGLLQYLSGGAQEIDDHVVVVWPDGFVDNILAAVDRRLSSSSYTPIQTLSEFGSRVQDMSGVNGNIELVTKRTKYGGNAPNTAAALGTLGAPTTLIGCLGDDPDALHPVFRPLQTVCQLISLGPPAHTDALEFSDGKLMLGKHEPLHGLTWKGLERRMSAGRLAAILDAAGLFVQVNWVMIPHMNEIWGGLLADVLPTLNSRVRGSRRQMFIDLCDPLKRERRDLVAATEMISKFQEYTDVVLGLNLNEARQLGGVLGVADPGGITGDFADSLRHALNIHGVTIHSAKRVVACEEGGAKNIEEAATPYTPNPVILTGAGDVFNAGFCFGWRAGWPLWARLLTGAFAAGLYVRTGETPTLTGLVDFLGTQDV